MELWRYAQAKFYNLDDLVKNIFNFLRSWGVQLDRHVCFMVIDSSLYNHTLTFTIAQTQIKIKTIKSY